MRIAQAGADGALGGPKNLTGVGTEVPLAGSDFWLSELGLEFYHWPRQNQLKTAMRRGQPCYVLESVNPDAKPGGAARVKTYIDTESGQPILAEAFGTNEKLLKEFSLGSIIKVNGRWQPKNLEISNPQKKSRTTLEFNTEAK